MILTAHQPAYLPWLGYFEKIMRSDVYIYMDAVQFERASFINRNKIKTSNGPIWLTVPVFSKGHRDTTMVNMKINNELNWQKKHFESICNNYKRAPYFKEIISKIAPFYEQEYDLFCDFCYEYTEFWFNELGMKTKPIRMKDMSVVGYKSELIINMCKLMKADTYISGALGKNYIDNEVFEKNNIEVIYQDYHPNEYPQLWGDFVPNISILDFVMNTRDYSLIMGGK